MEQPKLEHVELQAIELWFANFVDAINYDLQQIETAVPALDNLLTTIDTPPYRYLTDALNKLIDDVNQSLEENDDRIKSLESQVDDLNAKLGQGRN